MAKKMKTMDGNTATTHIAYALSDVACIYPITPSSVMGELADDWAAAGKKNLMGQTVTVRELQSEAGAAGAVHGSLVAGAMTSTFTASQGLLLMIPNMYKIAGELLPTVFHVSARALSTHALSIFGDHQDVMSVRQTGFAMLCEGSVQEVMDLSGVAHLATIKSSIPFVNFFDGFRTSHEIQKIEMIEQDQLEPLLDREALARFRQRGLTPQAPVMRGMAENGDVFFQHREASNPAYDAVPAIVEDYMKKISEITGRKYDLFTYYGAEDAENVIIAMGSVTQAAKEAIDFLMSEGKKVGLVSVHLYRPFSAKHFLAAVPATCKRIAVLDRTKEPGAYDPLCLDVRNAYASKAGAPAIYAGRYGLASKDFTPAQVLAVFDNLAVEQPRDNFTVGIIDDVTHTSLEVKDFHVVAEGQTACKFWGFGSDGTVGANKLAVKIIGDHTDMYSQAYFAYDSRKSGGVTISHLRFGSRPIRSSYLIDSADFIACHNQSYVDKYDLLRGIKEGGTFLLNCMWKDGDLEKHLPASLRRTIARKKIRFYTLNAVDIAMGLGLGGRINMLMQAAFFKLAGIIPLDDAVAYLNEAIVKTYGRKGHAVVDMNQEAVRQGIAMLHEVAVPAAWADAEEDAPAACDERPDFVRNIVDVMNRQEGDELPVSAFLGYEDGTWPVGITAFEKRGAAIMVPVWDAEKCVQCNKCAFACPHAAIRPRLLSAEEAVAAPASIEHRPCRIQKGFEFHMAISVLDCTGCGVCVGQCPAKEKALTMTKLENVMPEGARKWDYAEKNITYKKPTQGKLNVANSQYLRPLNEFSGACAGCGETPYAKLVTQLFGDRMMLSNSAGCSTVWAAGAPSVSYTTDENGHGPAWGFSLFEDNAEYGFGMFLGVAQIRATLALKMKALLEGGDISAALRSIMEEWLEGKDLGEGTRERAVALTAALDEALAEKDDAELKALREKSDFFVKRSHWIFGGDGWAYDIGYGGLDHVLASGEDINVLVFDTEVYSNTGGQSSKATPTGAVAQFAANGKMNRKKDLGLMAMSYGNVYVAQIAMGASQEQTLKAISEAEAYPGPSLIIAYSPCLNHGIKGGLGNSQMQAKRAVEAGYWSLYHYDPRRIGQGENPFVLDSKEPSNGFREFLLSEVRYSSLKRQFPERAEMLYEKAEADAKARRSNYTRLANK